MSNEPRPNPPVSIDEPIEALLVDVDEEEEEAEEEAPRATASVGSLPASA